MILVAATALPLPGCSFLFLDRPRDYGRYEKVDCTTSYALPAVDLGFTLLHLVSIGVLASASGTAYGGQKNRENLAQIDLLWLPIFGVSSGWGFYKVSQCNDLIADDAAPRSSPPRSPPRPRPRPPAPPVSPPAGEEAQPLPPAQPPPAPAQPPPVPSGPPVPQKADDE